MGFAVSNQKRAQIFILRATSYIQLRGDALTYRSV